MQHHDEDEEKEFYKLLPANKAGHLCQSWQSCSNLHEIQTVYYVLGNPHMMMPHHIIDDDDDHDVMHQHQLYDTKQSILSAACLYTQLHEYTLLLQPQNQDIVDHYSDY